jgi:16S rRNA (uracil1498-N3)-methyltransferase
MNYLYSDIDGVSGSQISVSEEAQSHGNALRLKSGELVGVLNGRGLRAICRVMRSSKTQFELNVESHDVVVERPKLTLIMGVLDSRDRLEFAIEKSIELGVGRIVLVTSENSQPRKLSHDRLLLKAKAALTQCGARWLPELLVANSIVECFELLEENELIALGDAHGSVPGTERVTTILVGPEGGFSARELEIILNDRRTVQWKIGSNRLRTETAAVALLTAAVLRLDVGD